MFKSIQHILSNVISDEYFYLLEDTEFTCEISIGRGRVVSSQTMRFFATAIEYKRRNLPIAKNLALFYLSYKKRGYGIDAALLERDKFLFDTHYPELEYGKKYYRCVVRQIKQLSFGNYSI
jgi:hypothetical protein